MPKPLPLLAVPADVRLDDISWNPNWEEAEWNRYLKAKAEYEAQYWADQHQKLAEIALLIEKDKREQEVAAHYESIDKWWAEQRAKEQEAWRQRELKRLVLIGKEIQRDAARLERKVLEERGVVRGRRR
jgi:hypothetical protein